MSNVSKKHYLQLYTGDGKGKTTAASGLALRGVAAGWKVFIGQFIKDTPSGEMRMLSERLPEITTECFGCGFFLRRPPEAKDFSAAADGLKRLLAIAQGGKHRMIIADELIVALKYELVAREDVLHLADICSQQAELIMTGRYAPDWLVERADLVSEIQPRKHYFKQGVPARKGIEL